MLNKNNVENIVNKINMGHKEEDIKILSNLIKLVIDDISDMVKSDDDWFNILLNIKKDIDKDVNDYMRY